MAKRDEGCCSVFFLKYVLYIFNVIFWFSGLALIGVGVWTLLDRHTYVTLLSSGTYAATTYLLLVTGGVIIVVGFIGCCGAWRQNRFCLMLFASFLFLIFLLEAVTGVLAYMYEATLEDDLTRSLNRTMLENYDVDEAKTKAIDDMHKAFKCCGARSFMDWRARATPVPPRKLTYKTPDSCCKSVSVGCAERDHPSNIYYDGCVHGLADYLKKHLIILGAVGLGVCCLQIFGIVFSCCLAKKVKERRERPRPDYL